MTQYVPRPPVAEDYLVLRCVTDDFERTREIAARYYGKSVEEATITGLSVLVARVMRRLLAYEYVERDYGTTGSCVYCLSDKGRAYLAAESPEVAQAA